MCAIFYGTMDTIMHPLPSPSRQGIAALFRLFTIYFAPRVYGLEKIKADAPALYVGNHTIFGLTDGVYLAADLYLHHSILLRPLVDRLHIAIPGWRHVMQHLGCIEATQAGCAALMQHHAHILVFPGGRREAFKR